MGEQARLSVAALGDLMLCGEWEEAIGRGEPASVFRDLRAALGEDLVFANLETSIATGGPVIDKEPRVLASEETLRETLRAIGVDLVNLANNHSFDALLAGFEAVSALLDREGIQGVGAGRTEEEAARPSLIERQGVRLGWLAYVDGATDPSHLADGPSYGANLLSESRALAEVESLRQRVDHVLVSLHWGVEYSSLPAPEQISLARGLVDAGATAVIGHHAHVVQGVERYGAGLIAYGLGNATTTDFFVDGRRAIRQSPRTRSSFVLRMELAPDRLVGYETIPFGCRDARIVGSDRVAARYLERANRSLARGVSPARWRRHRLVNGVVFNTLRKLHPSVIRSVRGHHFVEFFRRLRGAVWQGEKSGSEL